MRRQLIVLGEGLADDAYEADIDAAPGSLIEGSVGALRLLRAPSNDTPAVISRCLADIEPVPIQWFWEDRFALGKLSLVAGVPGLGKSQLMCAMAAAASTGGRWPDGTAAPQGSVIFITCEDDAADTIRPRLDAAGADVKRVHLLDWALGKLQDRQHFDVNEHVPALTSLVSSLGDVRLIVIDPITAYLGRMDSHVTADVRGALNPLQTLAAETGPAIMTPYSHASDRWLYAACGEGGHVLQW